MFKPKILVSGCSYTSNQQWPEHLFDNPVKVLNLGLSGSGNQRIAHSVISNCTTFKPDFVFILWSGMYRLDLRYPKSVCKHLQVSVDNNQVIDESVYDISGGTRNYFEMLLKGYHDCKDPSWPAIKTIQDWNNLPLHIKKECVNHKINLATDSWVNEEKFTSNYFMLQYLHLDQKYLSEVNFQHIMQCHDYLDKHKIPFRFSFIYDIWSDNLPGDGKAIQNNFSKEIDWKKFIKTTPYEYGVRHNLLSDDKYHLTNEGMISWVKQIRNSLPNLIK